MKSASQHTFARVPSVEVPRSSFKRPSTHKTTLNAGYLYPIYLDEVLPGDTFNFNMTAFSRLTNPLYHPVLDNIYMDFQFFFVPIRLVYDDYEKFFGSSKGQAGNWQYDDSYLMPGIDITTALTENDLGAYFGIPMGVSNIRVNALPFRCYNKIVNDWYLPSSYELPGPVIKTDSTDDSISDYPKFRRLKRCDYFTSSLIAPQRGPGASISLLGDAPVYGDGYGLSIIGSYGIPGAMAYNPSRDSYCFSQGSEGSTIVPPTVGGVNNAGGSPGSPNVCGVPTKAQLNGSPSGLTADLSNVSAFTINDLRQAVQLQRALERDMRAGGAQYVNQVLAHFGVRSPDARLQRSEFLGGGTMPINIHTVAATSKQSATPIGSLGAFATGGTNNIGWVKSFTEHGYVIGLASVRADLTYQQGIPKLFDRWSRFDFYYPVFAHLGEQVVLNKEIYAQGSSVVDTDGNIIDELPFGYQERFGEYRYGVSKVTGELNSYASMPLDVWHLAQKFNSLPTLNATFLGEDPPIGRVSSVAGTDAFLLDCLFTVNCVRPMPLFGVPGWADHF